MVVKKGFFNSFAPPSKINAPPVCRGVTRHTAMSLLPRRPPAPARLVPPPRPPFIFKTYVGPQWFLRVGFNGVTCPRGCRTTG